jgi:hypothetical protein
VIIMMITAKTDFEFITEFYKRAIYKSPDWDTELYVLMTNLESCYLTL